LITSVRFVKLKNSNLPMTFYFIKKKPLHKGFI